MEAYGDHGSYVMCYVTGTPAGITLDHDHCINQDYKTAYKRREDDVLLMKP